MPCLPLRTIISIIQLGNFHCLLLPSSIFFLYFVSFSTCTHCKGWSKLSGNEAWCVFFLISLFSLLPFKFHTGAIESSTTTIKLPSQLQFFSLNRGFGLLLNRGTKSFSMASSMPQFWFFNCYLIVFVSSYIFCLLTPFLKIKWVNWC